MNDSLTFEKKELKFLLEREFFIHIDSFEDEDYAKARRAIFVYENCGRVFLRLRDGKETIQNFGLRIISPRTESVVGGTAVLFIFLGFCGKIIGGRAGMMKGIVMTTLFDSYYIFDRSIGS